MNTTDFFSKNFDLTERDEKRANQTAITAASAAVAAVAISSGAEPGTAFNATSLYLSTDVSATAAEIRTGNFLDNFNHIAPNSYLALAAYYGVADPGTRAAMGVNPFEHGMGHEIITPSFVIGIYNSFITINSSYNQRKRPYQYENTWSATPKK